MPPVPKPAHLRQRKNKHVGASLLPTPEQSASNRVPPLPERDWHPNVLEWWSSVWRSPMAGEFLDADIKGGLYLLADLHQARWTAMDPNTLVKVAAEIRLQEVRFGLSPIDRRRLQWEVQRGEEAVERTQARRKPTPARVQAAKDPRDVLKAI